MVAMEVGRRVWIRFWIYFEGRIAGFPDRLNVEV